MSVEACALVERSNRDEWDSMYSVVTTVGSGYGDTITNGRRKGRDHGGGKKEKALVSGRLLYTGRARVIIAGAMTQ